MLPTNELSIETLEKFVQFIQERTPQWSVAKDARCFQSDVSKIWYKWEINGVAKKGKHGRSWKTSKRQYKNSNQYELKTTKMKKKKKWVERGVNVCKRTVRNRLNDMEFTYTNAKQKPVLIHKRKKMRLNWAEKKQSWCYNLCLVPFKWNI